MKWLVGDTWDGWAYFAGCAFSTVAEMVSSRTILVEYFFLLIEIGVVLGRNSH